MTATASQARELLAHHGTCSAQIADDWTGEIPIPDDIARFYAEVGPRDIEIVGYANPTFIPSLSELWNRQAGYRWNGLTGEPIADWPDSWIVVADEGADPYIFDSDTRRVLFAQHGTGEWDAGEIYPDLNTMAACIATLGIVISEADDFTDDDFLVQPKYRDMAVARLTDLLGITTEAEAIVTTAGWG